MGSLLLAFQAFHGPSFPQLISPRPVLLVSSLWQASAGKGGEELLLQLRTAAGGLTQIEAELRARSTGPNEVAQEKPQGWPARLLKITLNPLVILLTVLSGVSFATRDPHAGTVMAMMVALSVGLRFWQEARAGSAAAKLKAMIHVTAGQARRGKYRFATWCLGT